MSNLVRKRIASVGLAIDQGDWNQQQDYIRAQIYDMVVGGNLCKHVLTSTTAPIPSNAILFATGLGGCPRNGSGNMQVTNGEGFIHQFTSSSGTDGTAPKLLSYYLTDNELLTTLANPDATNPRIDIFCVKLSEVDSTPGLSRDVKDDATGVVTTQATVIERYIKCDVQIAQGTPNATPVNPSVPAGYVPLAYCIVYPGAPYVMSSNTNTGTITDVRYPLGFQRIFVPSICGVPQTGGHWALDTNYGRAAAGSAENMDFMFPTLDPGARILGYGVQASATVDTQIFVTGITGLLSNTNVSRIQIDPAHYVQNSGGGTIGIPHGLWGSGTMRPDLSKLTTPGTNTAGFGRVRIKSRGATGCYGVWFDVCGI